MRQQWYAHLALRIGAAFAFLYPPIAALLDPNSWLSYFPPWALTLMPLDPLILLHAFGIVEVILALWILSGRAIQIPAIAATVILIVIVALNWNGFDVVFRDLSIACMTLALALWPKVEPSFPPNVLN